MMFTMSARRVSVCGSEGVRQVFRVGESTFTGNADKWTRRRFNEKLGDDKTTLGKRMSNRLAFGSPEPQFRQPLTHAETDDEVFRSDAIGCLVFDQFSRLFPLKCLSLTTLTLFIARRYSPSSSTRVVLHDARSSAVITSSVYLMKFLNSNEVCLNWQI